MHGTFWDFTLAFYGGDRVSETLVRLQDECGYDVNILLYAIWRGLHGRSLTAGDARAAEAAIARWRSEVTEPLRDLRRRLKQAGWAGLPRQVQSHAEGAFRERLKALEIESEKVTQAALEALPAGPRSSEPEADVVAANLAAVRQSLPQKGRPGTAVELCAELVRAAGAYRSSSGAR